jgi:tetratricopeptide (TPR) repeat protein
MPTETQYERKYPRIRPPKGMLVGWRAAGQTTASRLGTMGLGGLFIEAAKPPSMGSTVELIFDLPGGSIRARAIVRHVEPGKGMGVQFVQMRPEDRAKMNRYMAAQEASPSPQSGATAAAQKLGASPRAQIAALAGRAREISARKAQPAAPIVIAKRNEKAARFEFERELNELITATGKGSYYELLGVTSDSPLRQIKKNYHLLARKFHPDNHADDPATAAQLKDLMVLIAEAYRTLTIEEKRTAYDKKMAARASSGKMRPRSGIEESIEEWFGHANDCLRAKNFVGSIVWLRKCQEAAPEQALYRALLARSLGTVPQFRPEAIQQFEKAIELDPWREPVYLQFGELLETMGLATRARGIYTDLLEFNPASARARERLAALDAERKTEKAGAGRWFNKRG